MFISVIGKKLKTCTE